MTDPHPDFLDRFAATYGFQLGRPAAITIAPDGSEVLFLRSGPASFERALYAYDVATSRERLLVTSERLLAGEHATISEEEAARRERLRLAASGLTSFELSQSGEIILIPLSGRLFLFERNGEHVRELTSEGGYANDPHFSPDGRFVACVREGDLYVIEVATNSQRRLTSTAGEHIENGLPEFVAQEEMSRYAGYWWSPDSAALAYQETNTRNVERLYRYDPMYPEQPSAGAPYPRPGRNNAEVRVGVIAIAGGTTRWLTWDRETFPYLATVKWSENAPLTLVVQDRRQRREQILVADPANGATTLLFEETDSAWLNLDQSMPRWLEDGEHFLWSTERGGAWSIELRRANDGECVAELLPPSVGYQEFLELDEATGVFYVRASSDPTTSHVFRATLRGDPPIREQLTEVPGMHSAVFAAGTGTWVHIEETLHALPQWTVHTGTTTARLESVASPPPFMPRVELVTVGESAYRAQLIRPANFDPARRYPVLVSVYGGPGVNQVEQDIDKNFMHQYFADQGFIVVSIDGRGTPRRGRAWERAIVDNFIDAPLHDQIEALTALFARFPALDANRVGIYGWSFGGYFSAMATMRHPEIFHAGVAGAPVTDWRDYDTHYTERYIGLPSENQAAYDVSSVLTYAAELERPLLILHGTSDDNVYFTHAIKMGDALFRAGRDFEFLPLPGATHMVAAPGMLRARQGRILRFFQRNLGSGP